MGVAQGAEDLDHAPVIEDQDHPKVVAALVVELPSFLSLCIFSPFCNVAVKITCFHIHEIF